VPLTQFAFVARTFVQVSTSGNYTFNMTVFYWGQLWMNGVRIISMNNSSYQPLLCYCILSVGQQRFLHIRHGILPQFLGRSLLGFAAILWIGYRLCQRQCGRV
jgi:hypothetical protein